MILTIAESFSNTVSLDSELTGVPTSGLYLNSGVNTLINVENLLSLLPNIDFTFSDYVAGTTYGKFYDSRSKADIVIYDSVIYQSMTASNLGNTPDTSPSNWLATNIESLRIKTAYWSIENATLTKLALNKRLINSQYLYNLVEQNENVTAQLLPNDYSAWVFEPKGSDYVSFTINQIALQATTATPQSLYVVNQGVLIDTLTLNPNAQGRLEFEELNYTFYGKGKFFFIIDSQNVLLNGSYVDSLKYDGFECYTATGIGDTPESAHYYYSSTNNGLNFNISVYLNPQIYIDNNLANFGSYIQKAWELEILKTFLANANNRSNSSERNAIDPTELKFETKDRNNGSVLNAYEREYDKAIKLINRTFDTQLIDNNDGFEIIETTI